MKCPDDGTSSVQQDYLYSTDDGGQTWQSVALSSDFTISDNQSGGLFFNGAQNGLALCHVIYGTTDGGTSRSLAKLVN